MDINNIWIDLECPICNYIDEVQLIDVKLERIFFCHNCKTEIILQDDESSVHNAVNNINKALNNLETIFKNFEK